MNAPTTFTEIELTHLYLDRLHVERVYHGQTLSLVGRIGLLQNKLSERVLFFRKPALWADIFDHSWSEERELQIRSLVERISRSLRNILALEPLTDRYRHLKRQSTYKKLDEVEVQTSTPIQEGEILVTYQCEKTGKKFARPVGEFNDGRFLQVNYEC